MRPGYIILMIVVPAVLFLLIAIWWSFRKRKIYQRLVDSIHGKGYEIDFFNTFASAGHTWLGRDVEGQVIIFIPETNRNHGRYSPNDLVYLPVDQLDFFNVAIENKIFSHQELRDADIATTLFNQPVPEEQGKPTIIKTVALYLFDKQGREYYLLLSDNASVAAAISSKLVAWVNFLQQSQERHAQKFLH